MCVFTRGCRRRVQRAGIDRWAGRARGARRRGGASGARPPVRLGAASARSSPVPAVRRAGLSPHAPGGGGEPRAARPRADAAAAGSRSAPQPPPPRSRSLARAAPPASPPPPAPRLRPVFLWARQSDGTVQEVRCEDYDPRNRIRIARTPTGWRVIPRTETYDSILVPKPPPRERTERRRRRRRRRERRRSADPVRGAGSWLAPDLESHIPSHTIAIPRMLPTPPPPSDSPPALEPPAPPSPPQSPLPTLPPPAVPEPTPMDNLLAVAELELELQSGALPAAQYAFRPEEEVARDVMSFDLGGPKVPDEIFFERKSHAPERTEEEDAFPSDMVSHKDLFESISEAHYLPELGGPHDEALLESLVEKGCEDNQILGQALDKLIVSAGEYVEEEDDMLLGGAPVADIIDRLESLESPSRSSMTAAQGLLHLHHIGDHLPLREHAQNPVDGYMADEVFAPEASAECPLETLSSAPEVRETTEVNHLEYNQGAEKRLQSNGEPADMLYTEQVPDINETYEENEFDASSQISKRSPERSVTTLPTPSHDNDNNVNVSNDEVRPERDELEGDDVADDSDKPDSIEDQKPDVEVLALNVNNNADGPTDLSTMYIDDDPIPAAKDLTIHRRLPTPHASPRRIEIPRAPSRESDAMQSPQPSGIPAISSPEVFHPPPSKNKTQSILDAMFTSASASPRMYLTSEVSITKQQCEPLNLGKHRKSASPTVSSCSEERSNKSLGEPLEKRPKRGAIDELHKITQQLTDRKKRNDKTSNKKGDQESLFLSPALKQFENLKANRNFNIPDPLLIPKDRLSAVLIAPGKEIPALLVERPELRYFDEIDEERDHDIMAISVKEFERLLINNEMTRRQYHTKLEKIRENEDKERVSDTPTNPVQIEPSQSSQVSQPKPIPSMGALAEEIDAATSATLAPMLWAQYAQQMEAVAACAQNADFLKALSASGYSGANYSDLSQMLMNHPSRLMNPAGFPMMPHMDYDRMQLAIWQEMMLQKMATQRRKSSSSDAQLKEAAAKTSEFQSPYVHSTNKSYHGRPHSSARTSPIGNYSNQRAAMGQHPFLQGMYPGMGGGGRSNVPNMSMGGLNVPYFNPSAMSSQRSPRTAHHKSPTPPSPSYYANNNYLHSLKASEAAAAQAQHRAAHSPAEGVRPRISVKKVDELRRRRDETEVGSTTPLGEPPLLPPDSSAPLWHPLFGNQKNYPSPWSWTTVTATGD